MGNKMFCDSIVVSTKEQVFCDVGGEAVILNFKDGIYYGLDTIGAQVWDLIQQPKSINEISNSIIKEYEVESALVQEDLIKLLEELKSKGLIEITNEQN